MAKVPDVRFAFTTPILVRNIPDPERVNAAIKAAVLERERSAGGVNRSNAGGWHSRSDLLAWPVPEILQLRQWMTRGIIDITSALGKVPAQNVVVSKITAWANVNRRTDYNKLHEHPRHDWSGVYYVAAGSPPAKGRESGKIEFLDPRGAVGIRETPGQAFGHKLKYQPADGMMLIFPSWLWHLVQPYNGEAERISIAFNAEVERKGGTHRVVVGGARKKASPELVKAGRAEPRRRPNGGA